MEQDLSRALSEQLGSSLIAKSAFDVALEATKPIQQTLAKQRKEALLPMLSLADRTDDLAAIEKWARDIHEQFTSLVVLGTGGSSLGGQTLVALKQGMFKPMHPKVYFIDNVDPYTIRDVMTKLDPARTAYLAVSKSGTTVETLTQTLVLMKAVQEVRGVNALARHFTFITMPEDNVMRRLAKEHGIPVIDHDPKLGGRFSVLSNVGLLPAAVAGLNIRAVRAGAKAALDAMEEAAKGAALQDAAIKAKRNISVLMSYSDQLGYFGQWYQQLWAESLGKQGHGSTPVRALGSVDQHSQLQLYLDGPRDKLLTIVTLDRAGEGAKIDALLAKDKAYDHLRGRTVGDVMEALQRGTIETLARNQVPLRVIRLEELNETTLGRMLMHFMLETVIAAELAGVDAFDQPAVEEGKQLARSYLLTGS